MNFKIKKTYTMILSYVTFIFFALIAGASVEDTLTFLGIFLGAAVVVGVIALIVNVINDNKKQAVRENMETSMNDFEISRKFLIGVDRVLYYDKNREKVKFAFISTTDTKSKDVQNVQLGEVRIVSSDLVQKFFVAENKKNRSIIIAKIAEGEISINQIDDFSISKDIVPEISYFAIDDERRKVLAVNDYSDVRVANYDDIIKVDILEDGTLVSSKSALRTIGGAAVGNLVAGGAGMVVGGLSGDTKSTKQVKEIKVKILLRDVKSPELTITIWKNFTLNTKDESGRTRYVKLMNYANQIKDIISVIIDNCDKKQTQNQQSERTSVSVADELEKLAKLKERGIITDSEFKIQKEKLLNE